LPENKIKINTHLQTLRNLNKVKQDMLLVPKTIHAEHCCVLKRKMKVKKIVNKSMMNNLVWLKRQSFLSVAMSSFCYQNPK
jgi:hypothetical protein